MARYAGIQIVKNELKMAGESEKRREPTRCSTPNIFSRARSVSPPHRNRALRIVPAQQAMFEVIPGIEDITVCDALSISLLSQTQ